MVTGGVDVGQRQEVRDQAFVGLGRRLHERPVGEWYPDPLSLPAVHRVSLPVVMSPEAAVDAGRVHTPLAQGTGVVGEGEWGDHEVARLDGLHGRSGLLDDPDELVADPSGPAHLGQAAVRPEVRAADAGSHDADQGVTVLEQLRVVDVFESDVTGRVENGGSHGPFLPAST
jgi:hypothetical protein